MILCWFNSQSEENPSSIKTMNMKKKLIYGNFFLLSGPTKEDIDKDTRCSKEYPDCSMRFCTTLTRCWPKIVYDWCLLTRSIMKPVLLKMNYKLFQHKTLKYIQTVVFSILEQNFNIKKVIMSDRDSIFGQVNARFASKGKYQQYQWMICLSICWNQFSVIFCKSAK